MKRTRQYWTDTDTNVNKISKQSRPPCLLFGHHPAFRSFWFTLYSNQDSFQRAVNTQACIQYLDVSLLCQAETLLCMIP
jgi:hypothetical protein